MNAGQRDALARAAVELASMALPVFRVRPFDKRPLRPGWQEEATTAVELAAELWHEEPGANIGVATGAAAFVVDVDGATGFATLRALTERHGHLPPTWYSRTQSGGWHIWFRGSPERRNTAGRIGAGVDTRGAGGYVVAPPSIGPKGTYRWCQGRAPWEAPLAELPSWLDKILSRPAERVAEAAPRPSSPREPAPDRPRPAYVRGAVRKAAERVRQAAPGTRNETLNREAFSLSRWLTVDELVTALAPAAMAAGLPGPEIDATLASAINARRAAP